MDIDLASPDAEMILVFCLVVFLPSLLLGRHLRLHFSAGDIVGLVSLAIVFSLFSLYYRTPEHWAGSRETHEAGWPHFFYDENVGFFFPSFLGYFFIDVYFYSSILFLGLTLTKSVPTVLRRKAPAT